MKMLTRCVICLVLGVASCAASQWQTNYDKALATAKAENKRVLINFTGSDWCRPCINMQERVFSQDEFLDYAERNLILLEIDYPARKVLPDELRKQNQKLKSQFKLFGFPTLALLDSSGNVLGTSTGYYNETVAGIIKRIQKWSKQ